MVELPRSAILVNAVVWSVAAIVLLALLGATREWGVAVPLGLAASLAVGYGMQLFNVRVSRVVWMFEYAVVAMVAVALIIASPNLPRTILLVGVLPAVIGLVVVYQLRGRDERLDPGSTE